MSDNYLSFEPYQIVCLELENTRLYSEVIQVITPRQMCWVRPWLLVVAIEKDQDTLTYNLSETADVVWPLNLFRPALDTEVIPFLNQKSFPGESPAESNKEARQQLNSFIRCFWKVNRDRFQA